MSTTKEYLHMRLDGFKKKSVHSRTKLRTMSLFSKIGIIYRFNRLTIGLLLVLLIGYLLYMIKDKFQSEDAIGFIIVFSLIIIITFMFLFSGMRRLLNAIATIEYGTTAAATVNSIKEWTVHKSTFAGKLSVGNFTKHKRGCITCIFSDTSGKSYSFEVHSYNEKHQLKKGDNIPIIYDPGVPKNVLAIDALPGFVKTNPAL